MDEIVNTGLYIILQEVICCNLKLSLSNMVKLSLLNKFMSHEITKCLPKFINLFPSYSIPNSQYYLQYRRGKSYDNDEDRGRCTEKEVDIPWVNNERIIYQKYYDFDKDQSKLIIKFMSKIIDLLHSSTDTWSNKLSIKYNKDITSDQLREYWTKICIINPKYKDYFNPYSEGDKDIILMISSSGTFYVFISEINNYEGTPDYYGFDSFDYDKYVLAVTITSNDILKLFSLLKLGKLAFILHDITLMTT